MRILHVIARAWPAHGGAEGYLHEMSRRLAAAGHTVTLATSDAADVTAFWDPAGRRLAEREVVVDGVRVVRFPIQPLPLAPRSYALWRYLAFYALTRLPVPVPVLERLARYTPWTPALWRWLDTTAEPFDLVAAGLLLYEPFVLAARDFARRRGLPFVVYPFTHLGAGPRPGQDAVSRYYTMPQQVAAAAGADALIAMTPTEGQFYAARGLAPDRITVAGAGVTPAEVLGGDAARFRAAHQLRGPIVALLSTLTADKGAVHLVEAARRLWAAGQAFELVLAGAVLAPFQRFLETLPAADRARVRVLGAIPDAQKRDLLAALDILAMPSRTDSFGIVYLEAWLAGKPVIGARAWGMSDVIADGRDGVLVPFGDGPALAEALAGLLADPARRAALGAAGRAKVLERYTWDEVYAKVAAAYARVARPGGQP